VNYTFGSIKGLLETARAIFFDTYPDDGAMKLLNEWKPAHAAPLVQIAAGAGSAAGETSAALQEISGD
jgi:hypothetical protein